MLGPLNVLDPSLDNEVDPQSRKVVYFIYSNKGKRPNKLYQQYEQSMVNQ